MELSEVDIKQRVPVDDFLASHSPGMSIDAKFKQSRYEDVWPDDVHAAFMEAVALYPPMGKRRLKYYRLATDENVPFLESTHVKSFGRCQLIQSYILDKTGRNRSRKQVSSHLQRFKKLHKDNPAMRALFLEPSPLPSDYHGIAQTGAIVGSQYILGNLSPSASFLKTEFDPTFDLRSTAAGSDNSSAFTYSSKVPSSICGVSMTFHNQPSSVFAQEKFSPQQGPTGAVPPSGSASEHPFELQDGSFFKESMGGSFQTSSAFGMSTFSMSMRRLASKIPVLGRQSDIPPSAHSSRAVCLPRFQSMHQLISHDDSNDSLMDSPSNSPLPPTEQVLHTALHPPQMVRPERLRLGLDLEHNWTWPKNSDISYSPLVPPLSRANDFSGMYLEHPFLTDHYSSCPETRVNSPRWYIPSPDSEGLRLARRLSYSHAPGPLCMARPVSRVGASLPTSAMPEPSENLASPFIIKPTPLYPVSYVHSEDGTPDVPSASSFEQLTAARNEIPA